MFWCLFFLFILSGAGLAKLYALRTKPNHTPLLWDARGKLPDTGEIENMFGTLGLPADIREETFDEFLRLIS